MRAGLGLGLGLACWLGAGAVLLQAPQCEAAVAAGAAGPAPPDGVPSLDDLAGEWMPATLLRDTPAISNWAGSVGTNVDIVDATSFIVPPFAGAPSMLRLRVDGKDLKLDSVRWRAYEAERRSFPLIVDAHTLAVTSQLRMAFNDSALLWKISVTNRVLEGVPPDAISYDDIIHTLEFSVQAIARQVRPCNDALAMTPIGLSTPGLDYLRGGLDRPTDRWTNPKDITNQQSSTNKNSLTRWAGS